MGGSAGDRLTSGRVSVSIVGPATAEYRRFLIILAARARRLGSRDPEGAAQEALRRSLENPASRAAIGFYFGEDPRKELVSPDWPLDHLLAWLHAVVTNVVREEWNRASTRREIPLGERDDRDQKYADPADPGANQLDALLQTELEEIVSECLPKLDREYRMVLKMRAEGIKYDDIARRLGVNENTVATWVSRAIRDLGDRVRKRMSGKVR